MPDHKEEKQELELQSVKEYSLIGKVLGEHYLILEEIGAGGMGHVYRARDQQLDREVAIKMMHPWLASRDSVIKRFQNEARLLTTLEHRSVLRTYGLGVEDGALYMVMDLVTGVSLDKWLKENGKIDLPTFKVIFADVLAGLAHAHSRGVLHRDIKPSNIVISKDADGRLHAMLLDFGLAKLLEAPQRTAVELTQTGELVGSPSYMSPEQSVGTHIDARSDIYSLCCVMYEALSGAPPFAGDTALEVLYKHVHETAPDLVTTQGVPIRLARVIRQGIEKDPDDRYDSVVELQADLEQAYSDPSRTQKTAAYHVSRKARKKLRQQRKLIVMAASLLVALAIMGVLVITNSRKNEEAAAPSTLLQANRKSSAPHFDAPAFTMYERFMEGEKKGRVTATEWEQLGDYAELQMAQRIAAQAYLQAADHFNQVDNNPEGAMRCAQKGWSMLRVGRVWEDQQSTNAASRLVVITLREKNYAAAESMLKEWHGQTEHLKNQFGACQCEVLHARFLSDSHRPAEALQKAYSALAKYRKLKLALPARLAILEELANVAHHVPDAKLSAAVADPMSDALDACEKSLGPISHARLTLGTAYGDLNQLDKASKSLLVVSKIGTGAEQVHALRQLGILEMKAKRPAIAEAYFKESIKRIPLDGLNPHIHASFGLSCQLTGVSLLEQHKDAEAKSYFEEANRHYGIDLPRENPYYSRLEVYGGLRTLAERRNDRAATEHWQELMTQVEKEMQASKRASDSGIPVAK